MVQKVEDIKVINVDDVPYAVDAMSDEVKQMVEIFNGWNQREVEVRDELMMVQSAKENISRSIVTQVRTEQEATANAETEATEATEAEKAVPVDDVSNEITSGESTDETA